MRLSPPPLVDAAGVRRFMEEGGWRGQRLAAALDIEPARISNWRTGKAAPPPWLSLAWRGWDCAAPSRVAPGVRARIRGPTRGVPARSGRRTRAQLKDWLARNGESAATLAGLLGIEPEELGRWLDGRQKAPPAIVLALAAPDAAAADTAPTAPQILDPEQLRVRIVRGGWDGKRLSAVLAVSGSTLSQWRSGRGSPPP